MPTQVLAPTTAAGNSSDITVTTVNKTVSYFRDDDDNLLLEIDDGSQLLLEDGDLLLLESQAGDGIGFYDHFPIKLKDPNGSYNPVNLELSRTSPFVELGPGTWRVEKPATDIAIGIQED